jgi:hypothetical protein
MKIMADDGTQFDSVEACLAHEATLPYLKLLAEVEAAVAQDAAFAGKIEALGTKLARERRERGDLRRERRPKDEPTRQITGAAASADIRADEGRGDARSVIEIIESLKDATSEGEAA